MANQEPQSGLFALRLTDRIERRLVIPAALTMPVSGGLLVWSEEINLADAHWLVLAIGLYVVAIAFAIGIQMRTVDRMIELATGMVAAGAGTRTAVVAGAEMAAGPGGALARPGEAAEAHSSRYAGPAAEMTGLAARARIGGFFLMFMVIVIVSLMAGKPAI
jgi:hypothetical protein